MAYGVVNADKLSGSNGGSISPDSSVFRNRIINGAMVIDQRNAGASVSITTDAKNYVMDRFWAYDNTDGDFSLQQVSATPNLFQFPVNRSNQFLLSHPLRHKAKPH